MVKFLRKRRATSLFIPKDKFTPAIDKVRYQAFSDNGHKLDFMISGGVACYSAVTANLSERKIVCYPLAGRGRLPKKTFLEYFDLLRENNVVPDNIKTSRTIRTANRLEIPSGNVKSIAYAALCFYRWQDSNPNFAYCLVEMVKRNPSLDFFQILHFAMSNYTCGSGHSFSTVGKSNASLYLGGLYQAGWHALGPTLVLPYFFRKDRNKDYGYLSVASQILQCAKPLAKYTIANKTDVLSKKLTPLFKKSREVKSIEELL